MPDLSRDPSVLRGGRGEDSSRPARQGRSGTSRARALRSDSAHGTWWRGADRSGGTSVMPWRRSSSMGCWSGVGDHPLERLGVAARTGQVMARLGRSLAERPLLRAVVRSGGMGTRAAEEVLPIAVGAGEAAHGLTCRLGEASAGAVARRWPGDATALGLQSVPTGRAPRAPGGRPGPELEPPAPRV